MEYSLRNITALIVLFTLFTNCKTIDTNPVYTESKIEKKIDSIFTSLNQNGKFNGNVLVAKKDKIIYNKGFGFSNGDKQLLLKATDKFNIGSIYKEIPAIAIMQLEEKGFLRLNDPIKKHLKNLPKWSSEISILNLLQYTSGLPKINWRKHEMINDKTLMNDLSEILRLEFIPGRNYLYTNYSPFLLSKIVENVTGEKFTEYVFKSILKPLKLNQSTFNESFPYKNRGSMAISFNGDFVEDSPPFTIKSSLFLFSTTTQDLFKLLKGIHTLNLINEKSLNTIGKTADLNIEDMESPLGQVQFKNTKIAEHNHHGTSGNYECIISRNNLQNTTIVILTNNKNENIHSIKDSLQELLQ